MYMRARRRFMIASGKESSSRAGALVSDEIGFLIKFIYKSDFVGDAVS